MIKVILFALLAVELGSCNKALEADQLYSSLLPNAEPLFEITNEAAHQKVIVKRKGESGLVFQVQRSNNEVHFKFNDKLYTLYAIEMEFLEENEAGVEFQFEQRLPNTAPTNIAITTTISNKPESKGKHGITAKTIPVDVTDYLISNPKSRAKSTVMKIKWVAQIITQKKPLFHNIRRSPATLEFVSPPVIIKEDEFKKLRELKDKMKPTYQEQFYKLVVGSTSPVGGSRNEKNSEKSSPKLSIT